MEQLIPLLFLIFILLAGFSFLLKLIFGKRAVDHAKGLFLYDLLKAIFLAPFRVLRLLFGAIFR